MDRIENMDAAYRAEAQTHDLRTETHGVCLISKDDAIETVCRTRCGDKPKGCPAHSCPVIKEFEALPSTDITPYRLDPDGTAWVNAQGQDLDKVRRVILDNYPYAKTFYADRPKGEWIEVTNGRGGHECSECHSYAPSYASGDEHLSDFCPNCGADMRGDKQ